MAHKDLEQDLILTQDSRTLVLSNSTKQINVREKIKVDFKNLAQIMKCEISHNFQLKEISINISWIDYQG